jgi:hypothetical protein
MKFSKMNVLVKDISQAHPGAKQYSTDVEYANLANRILDDFQKLRPALMWIYYNNYITRSAVSEDLTQDIVDELDKVNGTKFPTSLIRYHATVS